MTCDGWSLPPGDEADDHEGRADEQCDLAEEPDRPGDDADDLEQEEGDDDGDHHEQSVVEDLQRAAGATLLWECGHEVRVRRPVGHRIVPEDEIAHYRGAGCVTSISSRSRSASNPC